jgi:dTDP-4-dehydrorhamnose 3,5-epimerase
VAPRPLNSVLDARATEAAGVPLGDAGVRLREYLERP